MLIPQSLLAWLHHQKQLIYIQPENNTPASVTNNNIQLNKSHCIEKIVTDPSNVITIQFVMIISRKIILFGGNQIRVMQLLWSSQLQIMCFKTSSNSALSEKDTRTLYHLMFITFIDLLSIVFFIYNWSLDIFSTLQILHQIRRKAMSKGI